MVAAPPQSRPALHTAFLAELPSLQNAFDRYPCLALALPQTSPIRRPIALQTDNEVTPLDDRPWEFLEYLAPTPKPLKHAELFLSSRPIRDTASIPMALFKPQIKRDPMPLRDEEVPSVAERNLGDGLAGEPLIVKQTSTLLFAHPLSWHGETKVEATSNSHTESNTSTHSNSSPVLNATPANRPRRASAQTRNYKTGSSTKDAIDLDTSSSSSSDSDSDVEVLQPPPKRPRVGSTSERPTTSGKAPAKRTTGGKGVARKVTGGKNVGRKAPGKAPKKR